MCFAMLIVYFVNDHIFMPVVYGLDNAKEIKSRCFLSGN